MPDLSWSYSVFSYGMIAGAGACAVCWIIGFAISSVYNIMRK